MKNKKLIALTTISLALIFVTWCSYKQNNIPNEEYSVDQSDMVDSHTLLSAIQTWELSEQEKNWLIQMREEEKLARDVYMTLWTKWGNKIFNNIASSEQTHTDAVKVLLDRYWIVDSISNDSIWTFSSPTIQKLYDDLTSQWSKSLLDAMIVWATIEDLDIKDLNELLKTTDNEDIIITYNNLNKWSRNHLRAYIKNIESNGWTYTPQYISQIEYDSIISWQQETWGNWNWNGRWKMR